ncbi:phage protein NinX family protein [Pseudomonas lactis]|uniref:phage protein NinX family protein n=1 Tax=Pseudomonas lactis TaxID=1615674 RepID=UPI00110C81F1|nr:phage protein NinX family protein [Pseudomonas lactis]
MSEFVEITTADLTGAALNWAVAKATGAGELKVTDSGSVCCIYEMPCGSGCWTADYEPSTDWAQGGLLIDECDVSTANRIPTGYWASARIGFRQAGPTRLIAACRAIVASVLGETVSVPKELCHE